MANTRRSAASRLPFLSPDSVFRIRSFRLLFAATAVSLLGSQISYLALLYLAIRVLGAGAGQVGVLATCSSLAFLVVGLPAGVWVDRFRRRRMMITADLVRLVLLGSVPAAWWSGWLSMAQLYIVVLGAGFATVFFDVASMSYLRHLVGTDKLVTANARLGSMGATSDISGLVAGGVIIQVLSLPVAVLIDVASFAWSALCLWRIGKPETAPARSVAKSTMASDIRAGLAFVFGDPLLRPIAIEGTLINLFGQIWLTMLPVMLLRQLHLPASSLSGYLAVGSIGILVGANVARPLGDRLGYGRTIWLGGLLSAPVSLLVGFVGHGVWVVLAALGWFVTIGRVGVNNVLKTSLRQAATPDVLLGRMNATMRFLLGGSLAVGSALAGAIGELASPRTALLVAAVGLSLSWLPIYFSRVRGLVGLADVALGGQPI